MCEELSAVRADQCRAMMTQAENNSTGMAGVGRLHRSIQGGHDKEIAFHWYVSCLPPSGAPG